MKRITLVTAAATLALAMPALSAELGVKAGADAGVKAPASTSSIDTSADASGNFGAAVSAMNHSGKAAQEIQTLANVEAVTLVDVDTLAKGQNASAVANAKSHNQAEIENLQTAIESNSAVMAAIEAEDSDFDIDTVVAADVSANGTLVIYTQG